MINQEPEIILAVLWMSEQNPTSLIHSPDPHREALASSIVDN